MRCLLYIAVALYLFKFAKCYSYESYIESVFFLKVVYLNWEIVVGSIYSPPKTDFLSFVSCFENLPLLISVSSDSIICDDFSIDLLKSNISNHIASCFYITMSANS